MPPPPRQRPAMLRRGARSLTGTGETRRVIEFTASNIAAWTMARLRASSGGSKGAAAVVFNAMMFQSRTTSARTAAGATAIDALNTSGRDGQNGVGTWLLPPRST